MTSAYDKLYNWARKTSTSMSGLRWLPSQKDEPAIEGSGLIYRLKHWPDLPRQDRTADVFRTLSMMSNRPINRHWILAHSRLAPANLDRLLQRLVAQGAVEMIDASKYTAAVQTRPRAQL